MRQLKSTIGMTVVTRDTGQQVGRVKDVAVHRSKKRVVGFVLENLGWFRDPKVVRFSQELSFAECQLIIPNQSALVKPELALSIFHPLESEALVGTRLSSVDGDKIGTVTDIYFDDISGDVLGLEIQRGNSSDLMTQRVYLPVRHDVSLNSHVVVVGHESAKKLLNNTAENDVVIPSQPKSRQIANVELATNGHHKSDFPDSSFNRTWRKTCRRWRSRVQIAFKAIGRCWNRVIK